MKHLKRFHQIFESKGSTILGVEWPDPIHVPDNEYVLAIFTKDDGRSIWTIQRENDLKSIQDHIEMDWTAWTVANILSDEDHLKYGGPDPWSYYSQRFDQDVIGNKPYVYMSSFRNDSDTEEILMGRQKGIIQPDSHIEDGGIKVYGNIHSQDNDIFIIHTGDKYLLGHAPLLKLGQGAADSEEDYNPNFTFRMTIGEEYYMPFPDEGFEEGSGEDWTGWQELEDMLETGDYDKTLLRELVQTALQEPRFPSDVLELMREYLD